ncbi:hypothetical protein W02_28670 [Nitrospira sp. KM1]|uniref:hypothetical protein n=1 Tax=Nitrospira sp. KM1 TaxID=1936990 RepID=UPI0013A730DB|nr:hypothetical protein [Nitrospira sp. KM1]BCA55727.1 hypothetical protein W02_28670 [Nitrospira sp. KM1]
MPLFRGLLPLTGLLCLTSCTSSVLDLRQNLDLHRASFREKLAGDDRAIQQYVACVAPPKKQTSEAQETVDPVAKLVKHLLNRQPQEADGLNGLQTIVFELEESPNRRLDVSLLRKVVAAINRWHAHLDFDEDDLERDVSRFTLLLSAYNKAYFGNIAAQLHASANKSAMSGGFVDRNGNIFMFPGLSHDLSTSDRPLRSVAKAVTSQGITADLTRIFLEAFFDAAFQVPAVSGATALQISWPPDIPPYPEFSADHPPIPLDALARVTRDALRAEAAVTAEVGKVVRGAGVFGTGNETLAASLEAAGGIIARKLIEHEGFCYFRVKQTRRPMAHRGLIRESAG